MFKNEFLELIPICLVGLIAGVVNFLNNNEETRIKDFFSTTFSSMFICGCSYAILDLTEISYMAKIGVSALIAFLGIDKAYDYVKKFAEMASDIRHGKNKREN